MSENDESTTANKKSKVSHDYNDDDATKDTKDDTKETYVVKCHCGTLRGKFKCSNTNIIAWDCNCSDCYMRRNVHIIIHENDFTLDLLEDDGNKKTTLNDVSITYEWGTKTAKRPFCKTCGILPWYRPRSNPNGYGITLYCIDWDTAKAEGKQIPTIEIKQYDGKNWEKSHETTGIGKLTEEGEGKN